MPNGMTRARVVVCGASYGSTYLRAQFANSSMFSVVGVLGRGGTVSQQRAAELGIPCYTDPAQVPIDRTDAVCVAVGGRAGVELTEFFLSRGRPVLQEHPVGPADVARLETLALQSGTAWHINAHFADLPTVSPLVIGAHRLGQMGRPMFLNLTVNQRTLFSALDIVARSLGQLGDPAWRVTPGDPFGRASFFDVLAGNLAGVPTVLQCQRTVTVHDDGTMTPVGHHLQLGYHAGTLSLADMTGPVIWRPATTTADGPMWVDASGAPPPSPTDLQQQRDEAVATQVGALLAHAASGQPPANQTAAFHQDLSASWQLTVDALGPPTVV